MKAAKAHGIGEKEARRFQRLNECFLSCGADHNQNIQELTRAAGDLLDAACAFYLQGSGPLDSTGSVTESVSHPSLANTGEGETRLVRQVQATAYADLHPCMRQCKVQTYLECRVKVNRRSTGRLGVGWSEDKEPTAGDHEILQVLARAIAQQEQMRQREQELRALNEAGRVVTSALTLDEMLTRLRHQVRDVTGAEACSIALIDPSSGELVFRQADDPLGDELVGLRLQPGQGIAGQVAQTGQSVLIPDVQSDPRFYDGIDAVTGLSTHEIICAPLTARDKTIGVIELVNKRGGRFNQDDVRLLESVAAQTAAAVENARLYEATKCELADRIQAEQASRESTRRLQTLIDAAPDLIYLKDQELRYLLVNQAFAAFWDLEPGQIVGKRDKDLMPAALAEANQESDRQTIEAGQVVIEEQGDGERVIETRKAAVVDDSGRATGVVGIIRDITDRKRLEERAIQEQKEESILTLASGIAHDFNNALVGIVGNIDLLRMDLPVDPEVEKTLTSMEQAARRMASLTQQLLTYAGQVRYQPQPLNLNRALEETLAMLQAKCPPEIQVKQTLNEALWEVEISPVEIRQLLVNLVTNACESMAKGGGTLAIRTDNVRRESWICSRHRQHPAGEYVHLAVSDTGHGMEPEVQRRLFDPFFSTRFMGRGLGLAVAMAIARDRRGCLEVESHPGAGTLVQVYLPRA